VGVGVAGVVATSEDVGDDDGVTELTSPGSWLTSVVGADVVGAVGLGAGVDVPEEAGELGVEEGLGVRLGGGSLWVTPLNDVRVVSLLPPV
jgi:hypothetical protein